MENVGYMENGQIRRMSISSNRLDKVVILPQMPMDKKDKLYFHVWLKRIARELKVSGRLTEMALILSQEKGGEVESWAIKLREILEGASEPSLDLLMEIDSILAKKTKPEPPMPLHLELFSDQNPALES